MSNKDIYDLIIIGAGPAGITAGVYAARKKLKLLVITEDIGGQAAWSGDIENYTGYQFVTGPELAAKFDEHMRKYGIDVRESEPVRSIRKDNNLIRIESAQGVYFARSAIIASGKRSRELNVPGEKEFKNKGLTYCATCDGPLFPDKDVAVIGGGNSALDAALQMIKIAQSVTIINIASELTGDGILREKLARSDKVKVLNETEVIEIFGGRFVSGIRVRRNGKEEEHKVQGIFVEIGLIPNSGFTADDIRKNGSGEIIIDKYNHTSVPGIFAAGDVTDVPEKQIIIAAGEGSRAALGVFHYLSHLGQ
ncbi:MAG: FAD-dependent oxidoreductase [Candidatus Omnitrophota bacterium]